MAAFEEFNNDLFIDEIEKRRAIWDMGSSEYSNKTLKKSAWEEVVLLFCDEQATEEKKRNYGLALQKKWKHLRNNFVRETKKNNSVRSGSGRVKQSTYIHFERLQFLKSSLERNTTESNFNPEENTSAQLAEENEIADLEGNVATTSAGFKNPSRKKLKLSAADEHFANILERSLEQRKAPEKEDFDADKHFCLSLVNELKKVPENRRLKLKTEIYGLICNHQQSELYPNYTNNHTNARPTTIANPYSFPHHHSMNMTVISPPVRSPYQSPPPVLSQLPSPSFTDASDTSSTQSMVDLFTN